jgi:xanthine/CO dehydrogenase XdhC/CoxF family maturation factor
VTTHNHALDFAIVEKALERDDFAYIGLIGSASKRAQFARRLAQRGGATRRSRASPARSAPRRA